MDDGGGRDPLAEEDAAHLVDEDVGGIELEGALAEDLFDDIVFAAHAEPGADGIHGFLVVEPLGEAAAMGVEADAEGLALVWSFASS